MYLSKSIYVFIIWIEIIVNVLYVIYMVNFVLFIGFIIYFGVECELWIGEMII